MKGTLKSKSWFVTVPVAAMAAAYVWFVFLPGGRAVAELRQEIHNKQLTITGMTRTIAARDALEKERKDLETYVRTWQGCSSNSADVANLFGQIAERMKTAGVVTTRFAPEPATNLERLQKIPLRIGFSGSFSQICTVLAGIEKLDQRIWVEDFNVEKAGDLGDSLKCELNLAIFANNSEKSD